MFREETKEKLGNIQVKALVESCVYQQLSRYFEEHPQDIRMIIEKASSAANARESARKARELTRKKSIFDDNILPGKLTDCIESDPERTELFIVDKGRRMHHVIQRSSIQRSHGEGQPGKCSRSRFLALIT